MEVVHARARGPVADLQDLLHVLGVEGAEPAQLGRAQHEVTLVKLLTRSEVHPDLERALHDGERRLEIALVALRSGLT